MTFFITDIGLKVLPLPYVGLLFRGARCFQFVFDLLEKNYVPTKMSWF